MERIILEISSVVARKWTALSDEEKARLTRRLQEQLCRMLSADETEGKLPQPVETMNEPVSVYQTTTVRRGGKSREQRKMTQEEIGALTSKWGCGRPDNAVLKRHFEETQKRLPEVQKFFNDLSDKAEARGLTPEKLAEIMEWDDDTFEGLYGRKPNHGT